MSRRDGKKMRQATSSAKVCSWGGDWNVQCTVGVLDKRYPACHPPRLARRGTLRPDEMIRSAECHWRERWRGCRFFTGGRPALPAGAALRETQRVRGV